MLRLTVLTRYLVADLSLSPQGRLALTWGTRLFNEEARPVHSSSLYYTRGSRNTQKEEEHTALLLASVQLAVSPSLPPEGGLGPV